MSPSTHVAPLSLCSELVLVCTETADSTAESTSRPTGPSCSICQLLFGVTICSLSQLLVTVTLCVSVHTYPNATASILRLGPAAGSQLDRELCEIPNITSV